MPSGHLTIVHTDWNRMRAHVDAALPHEACGLLAGDGDLVRKVFPITNVEETQDRFRMEPSEQVQALLDIEASGWNLLAIYHSHPDGPAIPSSTDIAEWRYPDALSVIWSRERHVWESRAFTYLNSAFREVDLSVLDARGGQHIHTRGAGREKLRP